MHGRFIRYAIEIARELEPFRPGWLEEPVPPENLRALKKVADAGAVSGGDREGSPATITASCSSYQACDINPDGPDALPTAGVAQLRPGPSL